MLKTALIAAGAMIAATAVTVPANASSFTLGISSSQGSFYFGTQPQRHHSRQNHWRGHQPRFISERIIMKRLHDNGYRRIGNLRRQGNFYVARAWHPRRGWMMVRADARTGRIFARG